jgi:hypothetical protein
MEPPGPSVIATLGLIRTLAVLLKDDENGDGRFRVAGAEL